MRVSEGFVFQTVGKFHFGVGALEELGKEAQVVGEKALLIADRHMMGDGGPVGRIETLCRESGVDVCVFDSPPEGEPTLNVVDSARNRREKNGCDCVLALGGGSTIDTAKATAGLANESEPVVAYFDGAPIATKGIPWIALPTTAGAGAEATKNAVLSDPARNIKQSIRTDSFFADVVIVDPMLTVTCPPRVTADSGMDALAQAIESYTSLGANVATDAWALQAARLILRSLLTAYSDGENLEARSDMALGSLLAGIALANARLGTIHGLAHPIGIRWHIPHGQICALLLAPVMRFNEGVVRDKYARIGEFIDKPIIEHIEWMCDEMDIPKDLKNLGITAEELEWIIKESLPSGSLKMNPRATGADELREIMTPLV